MRERPETDDGMAAMPDDRPMNRTALILIAFIVTMIVVSNAFFDGTTVGGIAFVLWALALLALVGLGVRSLLARNQRT